MGGGMVSTHWFYLAVYKNMEKEFISWGADI
jgi:hypothetical protein